MLVRETYLPAAAGPLRLPGEILDARALSRRWGRRSSPQTPLSSRVDRRLERSWPSRLEPQLPTSGRADSSVAPEPRPPTCQTFRGSPGAAREPQARGPSP